MAKFHGKVGYGIDDKTSPGVYSPKIVEREYYGDVIRRTRRMEAGDSVNDDLRLNDEISIVADAFAYQNFHSIRYVEYLGTKWKVNMVEVIHPRMILTFGGVYNEH